MTTKSQPVAETCARLYGMAVESCAKSSVASSPPASETDALAASIAAQSNAMAAQANNLTILNVALVILLAGFGIGWGVYIKRRAESEAKKAAEAWMDANAAGEIARISAEMNAAPQTPDDQATALAGDAGTDEGKKKK